MWQPFLNALHFELSFDFVSLHAVAEFGFETQLECFQNLITLLKYSYN